MKKNIIVLFISATIAVSGYFIVRNLRGASKKDNNKITIDQSIAVFPFVNLSNDPEQRYFSDGLTEGILNSLGHLKGIRVSARTSSFEFNGKDVDIKEAGRKLNVTTILEGSVQRYENKVLITVQLINAEDGLNFWSEHYDENMDDISALQDKIAYAVAEKLKITISGNSPPVAEKKPTSNTEAYVLYLKGRSSLNLGKPPDLKKAIDLFQQAIALDSLFASAYSGTADCYNALGYGSFLPPKQVFPKAFEAATKALQLDSTLAEPHASLGFYKFYYLWDWAAAEQEFRIAISLNPNYAPGYKWYGYYLTAMERFDEADIILKKAEELDPLSVPIRTDIGFSLYYRRDYDQAVNKLRVALQMNPEFPLAHIWLGRCYQAKKMYPKAIGEFTSALGIVPDWPIGLAQIGNVYAVSGDKKEGQKILDTLISLSTKKFVPSITIALVYAGLGEKDSAFMWLNKAYEEHSHWVVWVKSDPRWIPFRSDKRFARFISSVGLPQ